MSYPETFDPDIDPVHRKTQNLGDQHLGFGRILSWRKNFHLAILIQRNNLETVLSVMKKFLQMSSMDFIIRFLTWTFHIFTNLLWWKWQFYY